MQKKDRLKGLVLAAVFAFSLPIVMSVSSQLFGLTIASQLGSIGVSLAIAISAVSPKTIRKASGRITAGMKNILAIPKHTRPAHN